MDSIFLSTFFMLLISCSAIAGPVAEKPTANKHIESIHLRLGVLNKVVSTIMERNLTKYVSVCKIAVNAKRVIDIKDKLNDEFENAYLIAGQHIQDICDWMASHTYAPNAGVNCSTVVSSSKTVEDLCEEISLTSNIASEIKPALKAVNGTNVLLSDVAEQTEFANTFAQDFPESIQAVICAPFGC